MEYKVQQLNWAENIARAVRASADGDVIIVSSEIRKELARRAIERMCPEKKLTIRVEGIEEQP